MTTFQQLFFKCYVIFREGTRKKCQLLGSVGWGLKWVNELIFWCSGCQLQNVAWFPQLCMIQTPLSLYSTQFFWRPSAVVSAADTGGMQWPCLPHCRHLDSFAQANWPAWLGDDWSCGGLVELPMDWDDIWQPYPISTISESRWLSSNVFHAVPAIAFSLLSIFLNHTFCHIFCPRRIGGRQASKQAQKQAMI